jgi:hypothetical protein
MGTSTIVTTGRQGNALTSMTRNILSQNNKLTLLVPGSKAFARQRPGYANPLFLMKLLTNVPVLTQQVLAPTIKQTWRSSMMAGSWRLYAVTTSPFSSPTLTLLVNNRNTLLRY